jgi:hypothetical protein
VEGWHPHLGTERLPIHIGESDQQKIWGRVRVDGQKEPMAKPMVWVTVSRGQETRVGRKKPFFMVSFTICLLGCTGCLGSSLGLLGVHSHVGETAVQPVSLRR